MSAHKDELTQADRDEQDRIIQHNIARWKREAAARLKLRMEKDFPRKFNSVNEALIATQKRQ